MSTAFSNIKEKMSNIQFGILRHLDNGKHQSWQVKAAPGDKDLLYCVVTGDNAASLKVHSTVNLIQKYKDDYLFISGKVTASVSEKIQVISIRIRKASWFERRSKGAVSWFLEKHTYESDKNTAVEVRA